MPPAPKDVMAHWEARTRLTGHLLRTTGSRLQLLSVVAGAGLAGFLTSAGLLHLQLRTMWLRYALSVGAAYAVFLILIWLWIRHYRGRWNQIVDSPDPVSLPNTPKPPRAEGEVSPWLDLLDWLDLFDDALPILLAAVAAIAAVAAVIYAAASVVALAPGWIAEMVLDGVFSAALYRRLRRGDQRDWLASAVGNTWLPFLCVLVFYVSAGLASSLYAPQAVSIGGVVHHAMAAFGR